MRRLVLLLAVPAVLAAGCDASEVTGTSAREGDAEGRTSARVTRVVDGDTVVLRGLGKARLIGVDTPEVYGGVECYGREASAFARRTLAGRRVRYRLGVDPRDRYDRALVDVWLADGRFFNALLVEQGYATPLTVPPNVEHAERLVRLARQARRAQRGLWAPGACAR